MTEATWGDVAPSNINWRMSVALENVPREETDVAEVTSLEKAVRAWLALDEGHRGAATLTTEHGVLVDGASVRTLGADGIARLAEHLPGRGPSGGGTQADDAG